MLLNELVIPVLTVAHPFSNYVSHCEKLTTSKIKFLTWDPMFRTTYLIPQKQLKV